MTGTGAPYSPITQWPRVALWGRFDVARFGELLLPRIHEAELRRRLPGARVLPWSPLGPDHPVALDGGLTALSLGAWSTENASRLAAAADAVILAGSCVLTPDDETLGADYGLSAAEARRRRISGFFIEGPPAPMPRAFSAAGVPFDFGKADATRVREGLKDALYISVRDDLSRQRLAQAGVERDVVVVPDPVALASRVFEPEVLARRLEYQRLMAWFPREGAPVVVQGSAALAAHVESLAAVLAGVAARGAPILLLEMEPADGGRFVEDLQTRLPAAFRLPASASLVDILAVFSGARCFIGDSESGHLAALGFGVPSLFLAPGPLPPALATLGEAAPPAAPPADTRDAVARLLETPRTNGLPESVAGRLEKHFDALAGFADAALAGRFDRDATARTRQGVALMRSLQDADLRVDAMRRAWETRSEQVAALRIEMADLQIELAEKLEAMEKDLKGDLSRTEQHLAEAQAEGRLLAGRLAEAQAEVRLLAGRLAEAQAEGRLLSGRLVALQADADRQMAERDAQIAQSLGELEAMRAEFLRLTNLRLFRYTAPFRGLYAALRRNLGRG